MSRKKYIVPTVLTISVVFTAILVYFVAIYRAESLLQQLVKVQSNGELLFDVEKVKLDIIDLRFNFKQPELRTRDSSTTVTGYHIKASSISFRAKSLITLLIGKRIVVDSVLIFNPVIEVFKYREEVRKKISLPDEMSKVYKSLEIVLNVLNLNYLHIDLARFKVFDYVNPANKPVEVSRLNLTVHKVTSERRTADNRFLFADRILFEVFNQDILFSDGFHGIKFKQFSLNTGNQTIELDSCYIYRKQSALSDGEYSSFVDTVRISKLDLNLLVKNDILKMDSALCINPDVNFLIPLKAKRKSNKTFGNDLITKDSLDFVIKKMLGNLDIGYLTIRNAKVKIVTKKGDESNVYNISKSNFSIDKLLVNTDPKIPIQVGRFNLDVRNYVGFSPDSLYVVRFDNVQILNKTISLLNFRIGPTSANHELLSKEITMKAFEFNNINWSILLYESRIVAGNVIMVQPELNFKLPVTKKDAGDIDIRKNPFRLLEEIRKKVQINDLLIKDGSVSIGDLKGTNFSIDHLNAGLNVNQLLQSTNIFNVVVALDTLSFANGEYKNPSTELLIKGGSFSKSKNSLILSQIIQRNVDHSMLSNIDDVRLNGININSVEKYSVDKLTWAKADLTIGIGKREKDKAKTNKPISGIKFTIAKLSGGPTKLNFYGNNIEASTQVNKIATDEIIFDGDQKPKIAGLYIDGQKFTINHNQVISSISDYNIQDRKVSTLSNVIIRLPANKELITLFIPRLIFSADISESINGNITADLIELQKPVISFAAQPIRLKNNIKDAGFGIPAMNISRLTIDHPVLTNLPGNISAKLYFDPGNSTWNLSGLNSDGKMVKADSIRISLIKPDYRNDKIRLIPTGKESVSFIGSDFTFNTGQQQSNSGWSVKLDTSKFSGIHLNTLQNDTVKQTITINSLNFENLILNNENVSDLSELFQNNDQIRLTNGNLSFENKITKLETFNLTLDKSSNSMAIDSIAFYPLDDKDTFMKNKQYQSNYMRLNTSLIKVNDIDLNLLINDAVLNAKKLTINNLHFYDYKDKRVPFQYGIEKPLLTQLLTRIRTKISIDSLLLKNAMIDYDEFNDKTQQYGQVKLSKIRGMIAGIKNFDFLPTDSIRFNLYSRFMNVADLRTSYAQSYTDSLSGFHLKMIASSFDLTILNPMLKPFASAQVKRGYLDTIRMSVIGQKYVAYGIMKMYYHNLNVQYLNRGNSENKTLKSRLLTFFANRIVNKENMKGSGEVYAERDPEKGFVNYWVKIFIGGVITNTGVRSDNKQEKKYYQMIKRYNVPPIHDIPVDY